MGKSAGKVYKISELVGTSSESYADATRVAIARASKTLKGLSWFEVTNQRGRIEDGKVSEFQVALKVGFRIIDKA